MRIFASIIAAVLLLTGCGSSDGASSDHPTSSTPSAAPVAVSTTPAPKPAPTTPTTLTREQAAAKYLALAKPANAVFDDPKCKAAEGFMIDGGTWPPDGHPEYGEHAYKVLRDCHKRLVPLYQAIIKAEQTTPWPVDAKADVADQISLDQAFLYCLGKSSKATSSSAMYKALECFPEDDGSADRVRARFGLPGRDQE